jgi:hypothetical protein
VKATLLLVISGFGLLLAGASSADSQDLSGSYYCTADASGGLVLNEATRKWEGSSFHAEGDKFASAMRFVKRSSKPTKKTGDPITTRWVSREPAITTCCLPFN